MSFEPALMGIVLGAGGLLTFMGMRTLTNKALDDAARKRGFWPLNAGLVLIAVSVFLFSRAG